MLGRVGNVHGHGTRAARAGLFLSARDHRSVGYRVPKEWTALPEEIRNFGTITGFKKKSKRELLGGYKAFECRVRGCRVCGGGS